MELIALEVAEKEWKDFLTEKECFDSIPKENIDSLTGEQLTKEQAKRTDFNRMVRAIQKGIVEIEDGIITQKLKYKITAVDDKNKVVLDTLCFKYRWTANDREQVFKGVESKDPSQSLMAQRRLLSILTGEDLAILKRIDVDDLKITDIIVSVFLM